MAPGTLASPAPERLRVDDHPAPGEATADRLVVLAGTARPALSWVVPLRRTGQRLRAHQIRVTAERDDPRDAGAPTVWDSGRREGSSGVRLPWRGPDLEPHHRYRWSVRCWDEGDEVSPWADPQPLETGPFTRDDWDAAWVEVPATHAARAGLELPADAVDARLHLTAQGLVRAVVDGVAVNGDCADPSRTNDCRALVRSYDVTDLLHAGRHVLVLVVAAGHRVTGGADPVARARVLAELVCTLADGTTVRVGTGPAWRHVPSPVVAEEAFYRERHDARAGTSWTGAGLNGTGVAGTDPTRGAAVEMLVRDDAEVPAIVVPDPSPPLHVVAWRAATEIGRPATGVRVFDVGQNVAARSRLRLRGTAAGDELRVVHGETLDDGRVSTRNIRLPSDADRERQVLEHVCAGLEEEVAEPWFAVYGFRYLEVQGIADDVDVHVEAGVLHSDVPVTGSLQCDDPLVERLVAMAMRTQLNNLHGLPEDCPTREQSGWTGDAAASAASAYAHLDMSGLYRKWLADLRDDQREDGGVLGVTPSMGSTSAPPDPVWGAAYPVVVHQHWLHTGDASLVREHLPGLDGWCDYQLGLLAGGLVRRADISYGHDWLAPEQTPPVMLQSCAVIASLRTVASLEDACGDAERASRRREQADVMVATARDQLRDPVTGLWANGSQGALALAITTGGLATPEEVPALREALRAAVSSRGNRLSSGFAATAAVVRALADADGGRSLLDCVHQPRQAGIGSMLMEGPGTFWETWWMDAENVGVASLDHIGLAAPFAEWAWTHVAGLRPTGPGWSTFDVAPWPLAGIGEVDAEVSTVRGRVRAGWQREGEHLRMHVEVPVGSRAMVRLPGAASARVVADGVDLRAGVHPHLSGVRAVGPDLRVDAPAGLYAIEVTGLRLPDAGPALGSVPDVPPGQEVEVPLLPGAGGLGGWEVTADDGWRATTEHGSGGSVLRVAAPATAVPSQTTRLQRRLGGVVTTTVVRAGRSGRWLGDGEQAPEWTAGQPGTALEWLPCGVVCSPVFHEPLPGPVALVTGAAVDPALLRSVVLSLDPPLDLGQARAVLAHVDFCVPAPPGRSVHPTLQLTAEDGTATQMEGRPLPVGWTRLAIDVGRWPGRSALVRVEVGVRWTRWQPGDVAGSADAATDDPFAVTFRLGRVGWTTAPLTW